MTKIITYVPWLYVSIDYVLFVSFWKYSFAVMGNFDTEFIASLLNEETTIEEVSLILKNLYPNKGTSQLGT